MPNTPPLPTRGHSTGEDIRALRRSRKMTLEALAGALDRSIGWLSQVERGHGEPSVRDLRRIAEIFEIPISFFFRNDAAPAEERGTIVRAEARSKIGSSASGLTEELLSPDLSGDFEMIRSVFAPHAQSEEEVPARPTQEGGYVTEGSLDLWIGGRHFRLERGDSFQFQNAPYRWRNPAGVPAVALWVVSPPLY